MAAPKGNQFSVGIGRPKKEIDWTLFESLCSIQCTQSEIASMFKVHKDTLTDKCKEHYGEDFAESYKKFSEEGKISLRRQQILLSKKNPALSIWLGKQYLNQREPEPINPHSKNDDTLTQILKELHAAKLETDSKLPASEQTPQCMGGCSPERKDIFVDTEAN